MREQRVEIEAEAAARKMGDPSSVERDDIFTKMLVKSAGQLDMFQSLILPCTP